MQGNVSITMLSFTQLLASPEELFSDVVLEVNSFQCGDFFQWKINRRLERKMDEPWRSFPATQTSSVLGRRSSEQCLRSVLVSYCPIDSCRISQHDTAEARTKRVRVSDIDPVVAR